MRSGAVRWSAALPAQPLAIAGDASGDVFVLMDLFSADAVETQIWKFESGGRHVWAVPLPRGFRGARSIAVLASGDLAVGACSVSSCFPQQGATMTSYVLRLASSDGRELWRTAMPMPSVSGLSADGAGRVLAISSGAPTSAPEGNPARVVLLDAGGAILLDQPTEVRVAIGALGGSSGDFILAGQDASRRPVFERRRSDGSLVFRESYETTNGLIDRVAFAPNGSIAVGGFFQDSLRVRDRALGAGFSSGFLVIAGGDGAPQWTVSDADLRYGGANPPYAAFGRDNDVVVYTMTFGKGQANLRSWTRDGVLQWRHDFRGIFGTWVNVVAVAQNGDVVVGATGSADAPFGALPFGDGAHFVAVLAR